MPEPRYIHICTGCGSMTEESCTDTEAVEEYEMVFDPDFEGEGPAWWCEQCQ